MAFYELTNDFIYLFYFIKLLKNASFLKFLNIHNNLYGHYGLMAVLDNHYCRSLFYIMINNIFNK